MVRLIHAILNLVRKSKSKRFPPNVEYLCGGNMIVIDDSFDTTLAIKALTDKGALIDLCELMEQRADEMTEYIKNNAKRV